MNDFESKESIFQHTTHTTWSKNRIINLLSETVNQFQEQTKNKYNQQFYFQPKVSQSKKDSIPNAVELAMLQWASDQPPRNTAKTQAEPILRAIWHWVIRLMSLCIHETIVC